MDKRKRHDDSDDEATNGGGGKYQHQRLRDKYDGPVDVLLDDYYRGLVREKKLLDPEDHPMLLRLIERELSTLENTAHGDRNSHVHPSVDLYTDPPITLTVKCYPPTKAFPKFNYAGRIIGPKGAYLKAIMRETMTKMVLLGQGVMKDKDKEQSLLDDGDPKYYHLNDEMHVLITVTAPASEAYGKIAFAINCLKRQVVSDNKELLSLPWIVRVIQNGEGPPQAYLNQGPSGPMVGMPMPMMPLPHPEARRHGSPTQRRPASGGYPLLPPPRDPYANPQPYYESHSPSDQQYRRYSRDPTPPRDYYEESSHRRPSSSRSPRSEFMSKSRGSGRSSDPRGSRGSPAPVTYYDYPTDPTRESYYSHSSSADSRGGQYPSAPYASSKSSKGSSRYTPYQK